MNKFPINLFLSLALVLLIGHGQMFAGVFQRCDHLAFSALLHEISQDTGSEGFELITGKVPSPEGKHHTIASHSGAAEEEDEVEPCPLKKKFNGLALLVVVLWNNAVDNYPDTFSNLLSSDSRFGYTSSLRHHLVFQVFRI